MYFAKLLITHTRLEILGIAHLHHYYPALPSVFLSIPKKDPVVSRPYLYHGCPSCPVVSQFYLGPVSRLS